jgi:hypothetical protein
VSPRLRFEMSHEQLLLSQNQMVHFKLTFELLDWVSHSDSSRGKVFPPQ